MTPDDPPKPPSASAPLFGAEGGEPASLNGKNGVASPSPARPKKPAPPQIEELAGSCLRFVLAKYGVRLDGTHETLSVVDQYVRDARADVVASPESLPLLEATIGAYLGEVIRTEYDAEWFAEGDPDAWRLDLVHAYLTFNPVGMAREALTLTEAEGWHAHLEMDPSEAEEVQRRLAALPEVRDDEYYAPTTRFDVVALAVDALRAQMIAAGLGDVTFGAEDYRSK